MMFNIVLVHPQIPPNTGNILRLCANTGCMLHVIEPLGFDVDDKQLRRAGLDYVANTSFSVHANYESFVAAVQPVRIFTFSTQHKRRPDQCRYQKDDVLIFGSETAGLSQSIREAAPENRRVIIPMRPGNRSLNLSNAVAIAVYEGWRQLGYAGAEPD